jgi:hypothetical protein
MAIVVGWWVIPLVVFVAGIVWGLTLDDGDSYLAGMGNTIIIFGTICMTLALVAGHYL